MTLIRDMTPRSGPRLIEPELEEPEIYFRPDKGEVWIHLTEDDGFPLAVGLPNPHFSPKPTPAQDFHQPEYSGRRHYDRRLDCWVKAPRREPPVMRRPRPTPTAWSDTSGPFWWLMCRETGHKMVRVRAQTAFKAQNYAAIYALAHQLPADAAYALKD